LALAGLLSAAQVIMDITKNINTDTEISFFIKYKFCWLEFV